MGLYKITFEHRRDNQVSYSQETVQCNYKPRIGESTALLSDPPIIKTIINVQEIK